MTSPEVLNTVHAAGGGYGPPPGGGYGQPGGYGPPGGVPMGPPGGNPMAPPGGFGAPMPGGMGPGGGGNPQLEKSLQTWFIISIASIFCACGCFAAVPIYLVYTGKQALAQGDVAGAQAKLKYAKICIIVGAILMVISVLVNVALQVMTQLM